MEILVRIAGSKYKGSTYSSFKGDSEQVKTYSRALEILIKDNITQ